MRVTGGVKRARWLAVGLSSLVASGVLVTALLVPTVAAVLHLRENDRRETCLENVRHACGAVFAYCCDWDDGRYPPRPTVIFVRSLGEGKVTGTPDLQTMFPPDDWHRLCEYYHLDDKNQPDTRAFICPSTHSIYAYQFNTWLHGLTLSEAYTGHGYPDDKTVVIYEVGFLTGTPVGPHFGGYNTGYSDGHVKWQSGPLRTVKDAIVSPLDAKAGRPEVR